MQGYGYPKVYGAIPVFLGLDAAFSALLDDVDTAEKITLINERICGFDEKGQPIAPNEAMKRRFVFLGDQAAAGGRSDPRDVPADPHRYVPADDRVSALAHEPQVRLRHEEVFV